MQAIRTRYHGPTNTRGSRISAQAEAGRITFSWNCAVGIEENHRRAALAYAKKYEWLYKSHLEGGEFQHDYYWVLVANEQKAGK